MKYEIIIKSAAQKWILGKQFCAIFVKVFRSFVTRRCIDALLLVLSSFFSLNSPVSAWYLQFEMSKKTKEEKKSTIGFFLLISFYISFGSMATLYHSIKLPKILSFDWKEKHIFGFCWNFRLKGLFSHLFGACNAQQLYDDRYHVNKFSLEAIILYSLQCLFSIL